MNLGIFSVSLTVNDLEQSLSFYQSMGFDVVDGGHINKQVPDTASARWRALENGEAKLGLFEGMFEQNILTFCPSDVRAIQASLMADGIEPMVRADPGEGPAATMLKDPDGNLILLDQR